MWVCFRLEPTKSLEENQRSLLQMTDKFFQAIINSSSEFPPQLRSVCHCLYQVCLQWLPTPKLWGWFVKFQQFVCLYFRQFPLCCTQRASLKTLLRRLLNDTSLNTGAKWCFEAWAGNQEVTESTQVPWSPSPTPLFCPVGAEPCVLLGLLVCFWWIQLLLKIWVGVPSGLTGNTVSSPVGRLSQKCCAWWNIGAVVSVKCSGRATSGLPATVCVQV